MDWEDLSICGKLDGCSIPLNNLELNVSEPLRILPLPASKIGTLSRRYLLKISRSTEAVSRVNPGCLWTKSVNDPIEFLFFFAATEFKTSVEQKDWRFSRFSWLEATELRRESTDPRRESPWTLQFLSVVTSTTAIDSGLALVRKSSSICLSCASITREFRRDMALDFHSQKMLTKTWKVSLKILSKTT